MRHGVECVSVWGLGWGKMCLCVCGRVCVCVCVTGHKSDGLPFVLIFASELVSAWMLEMGVYTSITVSVQVPGVNSWACEYVWDRRMQYLCVSFQKASDRKSVV